MSPYREATDPDELPTWWQGVRYGWGRMMGSAAVIIWLALGWVFAVMVVTVALLVLTDIRKDAAEEAVCRCNGGVYHEGKCFEKELKP